MSNETLIKNYSAGANVTKRRIVKWGSADKTVVQAAAQTDKLIGVSTDADAISGGRCDVIRAGIAEVEYGSTITRGDLLTADANGKAVAVAAYIKSGTFEAGTNFTSATGTVNQTTPPPSGFIIGTAEVSGLAGDVGEVHIAPSAF